MEENKKPDTFSPDAILAASEADTRRVLKEVDSIIGPAKEVSLYEAGNPENVGIKIKFRATSAGKDLHPYVSPRKVVFTCAGGLRICEFCPIFKDKGKLTIEIRRSEINVLRMIDVNEDQVRGYLHKAAGIPPKCPRYKFEVEETHNIEDVRLMPEISFSSDTNTEYMIKQAYYVGYGLKTNATYEFEATPVPAPKDQMLTYILSKATPVRTSIENFKVTEEFIKEMAIFRSDDVAGKMAEIANDLTYNVTRIYQREDLINMIDLIYHSVLQFNFQGRKLNKGWTEGLILGDTRCGKTETVSRLIEHYRAGEISSGENCSFAGLIGGLQQTGSRWSITWGKLPLNDRRLFVVDEISGMPLEDIGKMSGVRSSGIAEITKVQSEKTFARVRSLWMGNPRESRSLGTYDTGVQAIPGLIGRPEDIARFDIAIAVGTGDVPLDIINQGKTKDVRHVYTSDACSKLVMWAWSRRPRDVHITKEAEELCLKLAQDMGRKYSPMIPLVEPSEQRVKIMRLSVACAARLFSTSSGEDVLVLPVHVAYVHSLLERLYGSPSMNYAAYSQAKIAEQSLKDEKEVSQIITVHGPSLVEGLLSSMYFRLSDLEDLFDVERKVLKSIIAKLIKNRALRHSYSNYVKNPAFIELLRRLQKEGIPEPTSQNELGSMIDRSFQEQEEML